MSRIMKSAMKILFAGGIGLGLPVFAQANQSAEMQSQMEKAMERIASLYDVEDSDYAFVVSNIDGFPEQVQRAMVLSRDMDEAEAKLESIRKENAAAVSRKESIAETVAGLTAERVEIEAMLKNMEARSAEMRNEIAAKTEEIARLDVGIEERTDAVRVLDKSIEESRSVMSILGEKLTVIEKRIEEASGEERAIRGRMAQFDLAMQRIIQTLESIGFGEGSPENTRLKIDVGEVEQKQPELRTIPATTITVPSGPRPREGEPDPMAWRNTKEFGQRVYGK